MNANDLKLQTIPDDAMSMGEMPHHDTMRLEETSKYLSPEIKGARRLREFTRNSQHRASHTNSESSSGNLSSLQLQPANMSKSSKMKKVLAASSNIANHPKLKALQGKQSEEEGKVLALSVSDTIYASPYFSTQEEVLKLVAQAEADESSLRVEKKAQLPPLHKQKKKV